MGDAAAAAVVAAQYDVTCVARAVVGARFSEEGAENAVVGAKRCLVRDEALCSKNSVGAYDTYFL